jgi:oxygen-independent coproporphyrinogen-3 oxidase
MTTTAANSTATMIKRHNFQTYPSTYRYVDYDEYFSLERAALYLHVPFCMKKCSFCDFTVYLNKTLDARERYVRALEREIRRFPSHGAFPNFSVDAVYFGGGTPGLLKSEQLVRLFDACRETFRFNAGAEITLEFDPVTVTPEKIETLSAAGFNRMSMGIQSFDDTLLKLCNRSHDAKTAEHAYRMIRNSGFSHVNIDLIFALPTLTFETWKRTFDRAIELEPGCISTYLMELLPKTPFHHQVGNGTLALPTQAEERAMYEYVLDSYEQNGFRRGTTTGYYHPERSPRYSRFMEYYSRTWPMIGFGVSARSAVHERLYTNVKGLTKYFELVDQDRIPLDFANYLTKEQEMRRVVIRGLKWYGVSKSDFRQRFGMEVAAVFGEQLAALTEEGLVIDEGDDIILTRQGQLHATSVNIYERFYAAEHFSSPGADEISILT